VNNLKALQSKEQNSRETEALFSGMLLTLEWQALAENINSIMGFL